MSTVNKKIYGPREKLRLPTNKLQNEGILGLFFQFSDQQPRAQRKLYAFIHHAGTILCPVHKQKMSKSIELTKTNSKVP
jgi:hypothetical protein